METFWNYKDRPQVPYTSQRSDFRQTPDHDFYLTPTTDKELTVPELTSKQKTAMHEVLYMMSKEACRSSFRDFLEYSAGITTEEWKPIKEHIEKTLDVKLYA